MRDDVTFAKYAEKWLHEKVEPRLSPSTLHNYRGDIALYLRPRLGQLALKQIRVDDANAIILTMRSKGLSTKTINCTIGTLQTLLNAAVESEYLAANPLRRLRLLREDVKEFAFMSESEVKQFLRACLRDPLYPLYVVAVNTGMRRGELAAMKWDRRLMREQRGEFVFSRNDGRALDAHHLSRRFKRAVIRAGLPDRYRFHDIRHTFASHFMMRGGNVYDLQRFLGHHSISMTERYAHLSPSHLERAIGIVSFSGTDEATEQENRTPEPANGSEVAQIAAPSTNS